jgi:mono/diheme cytochrome c family protein
MRLLLTDKLACLGCHRLADRGGQIGPDLTQVRSRLQPGYVFSIITQPHETNPRTVMPQVPLTMGTAELLANLLLQEDLSPKATVYLSAMENALIPFESQPPAAHTTAKDSYLSHCAACHGSEGRGDGFNARFLPRTPTAHADATYMSTRADDTLFDGIASGGAILNKSHLMPPWGRSLSPAEIKSLVAYMRTLCHCQEPAWAADNNNK